MNPVTEQNRIEAYRNSPENIRELYASDNLSREVDLLHAQFEIAQPFRSLSEIIGDTILGFYKISDLPRLFQQKLSVSADQSQRMTSKLIDILGPVVQREEKEGNTKKEALSKLTQTFAKPEGLGVAPATQYEDVVEPIRTMSGDMNRVHGYGAYRAQDTDDNGAAQSDGGGDSSSD
jgi:hypothetical protein